MESTPEKESEKPQTSYLQAISSWGLPRSTTPRATLNVPGEGSGLKSHGEDHTTQHWHGLSLKRYPADCPPMRARWYYATDVPKRKPKLLTTNQEVAKLPAPKKFVPFSEHDSQSVEDAYQKLAEEYDDPTQDIQRRGRGSSRASSRSISGKPNTSINEAGHDEESGGKVQIPVQEDSLFDVDIERRELAPVYWLGPIYEVRRGSWFYQEGTTLRPCEERLAAQLEEGYLKVKPWKYPKPTEKVALKSIRTDDELKKVVASEAPLRQRSGSADLTPRASIENLRTIEKGTEKSTIDDTNASPHQPETYRLFGAWMNSIVTYQDSSVAWLSADSIMSRVSSTVYQKFAGGGYYSGVKIVRGFEYGKEKEAVGEKTPSTPVTADPRGSTSTSASILDEKQAKLLKRRSAPPATSASGAEATERAARSVVPSLGDAMQDMEDEAVRKRNEEEIENDYNDIAGESQGRRIDHLILVTHGIGQRLGMRTESVNFIGDVNALRHSLKNVYDSSADLQALNSEINKLPRNCRIQVLPICWRHLLDFPRKGVRQARKEHDLGDILGDEEDYPSLEDITIEGMAFVRSLITDLGLDILLYQSAYREHICNIVHAECNRIYHLFCERNPEFNGKVSLIGHSLGSAILFDILSRQKETKPNSKLSAASMAYKRRRSGTTKSTFNEMDLDFEVEDFYCLGSPIGLFQMLKGRNILARHSREDAVPAESPMDPEFMQDPFLAASSSARGSTYGEHISSITGLPPTVSSPKVGQLYNIFHPSDPIAYRVEPLISAAMSSMKPQLLPYTKKSVSASVSDIGTKINQSVSGIWSSLSSGLASSILNRSLGLTSEDVARMETPNAPKTTPLSVGAGTNISGGGVIPPTLARQNTMEKQTKLAKETAAADLEGTGSPPATLIDDEIETLFSGFQKQRANRPNETDERNETEINANKLRTEEAKIRALNRNGRVDYSIQESVLDFNPMNTIASHLSYWTDEDVAHFMMSQLLSRNRKPM